jgi:group I intron endonuclease
MKGGIYRLYWDNNDYYYYGQAINLNRRKSTHTESAKKNKHKNPKVQNLVNKYGIFNFEIIQYSNNEELDMLEQIYLDKYFGDKNCCNICPIASSSKGRKYDKEVLERMRSNREKGRMKGSKNPFYGKKHTQETKDLISVSKIGKKYPAISLAKKGVKSSKETKIKLSLARSYAGAPKAKIVLDLINGVFYSCAKEVSDLYGYNQSSFRASLNGQRKNNTNFIYA